jgi:glucuronoarabinoxylan endo-1,4-beta-xylanase
MRSASLTIRAVAVGMGLCAAMCTPTAGPKTGTQTNWLTVCQSDADCGDLRCLCGACTWSCGDATNCDGLTGASCVHADDEGAVALCGGSRPASYGLCLLPCSRADCPEGTSCVAGVCSPIRQPTVRVLVDDTQRFQTLVGIGAGLAYVVDEVAQHPRKAALFDAMFADSGFTVLRLRNRYGQNGEEVGTTGEVVSEASERMGQVPTIILNSASPPGTLKANGSNWCEGNPDTCTLVTLSDGSFDYAGLATHWRESLDAYAAEGVVPDYVSIQNNPDWVPPAGYGNEACRLLPSEGSLTVTVDGDDVDVAYPGYAEALEAVLAQLDGLASVPRIVAPESTGLSAVAEYVAELDMASVDAIAHHLYGSDAANLDLALMTAVGELGEQHDRPVFQSEMYADALTTAVLMHASFVVEGASVYVENGFVASASDIRQDGLINLSAEDFTIGDTYHVVRHYAGHVRPGWVRVTADSDDESILASAWVSPEEDALAVVLTNPGSARMVVQLEGGAGATASTSVTRTVLGDGTERSVELGELSAEGVVTLPGQSIVTVTMSQ